MHLSFGAGVAIPDRAEDSIEIALDEARNGDGKVCIALGGAKQVVLQFAENCLLCSDDQGREIALNLGTRPVVRDLSA